MNDAKPPVEDSAGSAFPWPLSRFERQIPGEQGAVARFINAARQSQAEKARAASDGRVRRAIHAKGHGLVVGNFHVHEPANRDYRAGLFQQRKSYKVLLRPSNGDSAVRADGARDAHGLAMRVVLTEADLRQLGGALLVTPATEQLLGQDFVFMDEPEFFVPNIDSLAELFDVLRETDVWQKLSGAAKLLRKQEDPLRIIALLAKTFTRQLRHPLATTFHSASPYALGDNHVVKYSVEPANPARFAKLPISSEPNYLRTALAESLRDEPIELKFFIHVMSESMVPVGYGSLADIVENATLSWPALGSIKLQVASIELPRQDPTDAASQETAETFRFNPWHSLEAHRPLGSLNRARLSAYPASQRYRSEGAAAKVPNAAE